jgi:hypothetical protein
LRKLSIRRQVRIRFRIANGLECIVTEHGIAEVPGLHAIPDFNLEQELESASEFVMEPAVVAGARRNSAPKPHPVSRGEMVSMVDSHATAAAPAHEHEEE